MKRRTALHAKACTDRVCCANELLARSDQRHAAARSHDSELGHSLGHEEGLEIYIPHSTPSTAEAATAASLLPANALEHTAARAGPRACTPSCKDGRPTQRELLRGCCSGAGCVRALEAAVPRQAPRRYRHAGRRRHLPQPALPVAMADVQSQHTFGSARDRRAWHPGAAAHVCLSDSVGAMALARAHGRRRAASSSTAGAHRARDRHQRAWGCA